MSEQVFRGLLLAVMAASLAIGIYHRVRAHTGEKLDRRQEGWALCVAIRLCGLSAWAAILAYLIRPQSMAWAQVQLPAWLRLAGAGLGVAAATLLWWVLHTLGGNLTDTVVTRRQAKLVTGGPYRWVRHPFYGAATLLFVAVTLLAANWFFLAAFLPALALLVVRTRKEEAKLLERFGEQYLQYMGRTGRFAPRLRAKDTAVARQEY